MISIETERLHLRNLSRGDADIMADYRSHEACSRYQRGQAKDHAGIIDVIKRRENDALSAESPFMVAVALKETDEMIGELVVKPKDGVISLGYTISYKYHRQGYAFEALTALIETLHRMAPEAEFISFTEPDNLAGIKLLEKSGYKFLGAVPSEGALAFGRWTTQAADEKFAGSGR